jgi:hypothetical protein
MIDLHLPTTAMAASWCSPVEKLRFCVLTDQGWQAGGDHYERYMCSDALQSRNEVIASAHDIAENGANASQLAPVATTPPSGATDGWWDHYQQKSDDMRQHNLDMDRRDYYRRPIR